MGRQQFDGQPKLQPFDDGVHWSLLEEFDYTTDEGMLIRCPKGMVTDFASVPKLFWNILPPWGKYGKAALVHDFLYSHHRSTRLGYSRSQADWILVQAMVDCGCNRLECIVIYLAVRLGGWKAWGPNEKIDSEPGDPPGSVPVC